MARTPSAKAGAQTKRAATKTKSRSAKGPKIVETLKPEKVAISTATKEADIKLSLPPELQSNSNEFHAVMARLDRKRSRASGIFHGAGTLQPSVQVVEHFTLPAQPAARVATQQDRAEFARQIRALAQSQPNGRAMLETVWRVVFEAARYQVFEEPRFALFRDFFVERDARTGPLRGWKMLAALQWLTKNAAITGITYPPDMPSIEVQHLGMMFPNRMRLRPHIEFLATLTETTGTQSDQKGRSQASGLSRDTYNTLAMEIAKTDESFAKKPTVRGWSKRLGCSTGLVSQLPFFAACASKAGTRRKGEPLKPKVFSWNDSDGLDDDDAELERLIAEQQCDAEPSPLEKDVPGRPRTVQVKKTL